MDRNTVIGFSLIFLILTGYYWYTAPTPEQQALIQKSQDSLNKIALEKQQVQNKLDSAKFNQKTANSATNDSLLADKTNFAAASKGTPQDLSISNKHLTVTINSKGGAVSKVVLSQYQRADSTPLVLIDPIDNQQSWTWTDQN